MLMLTVLAVAVAHFVRHEQSIDDADREFMGRQIGPCVEPENPSVLVDDEKKWDELIWSRLGSDNLQSDGWQNNPFGKSWLPAHKVIGLVHDPAKYKDDSPCWGQNQVEGCTPQVLPAGSDSRCFQFDYDDETAADPSGCRIFRKSFQPLQTLRQCIVDRLDSDPVWSKRGEKTITDGNFTGNYADWCEQATWGDAAPGMLKSFKLLPVKLCDSSLDTVRRAEEMIKFATAKPLPAAWEAAVKKLESKLQFTVSWPKGQPSLAQATAAAIREECFELGDGVDPREGRPGFYSTVGGCLPLMFDKVEIQGFGFSDGDQKFMQQKFYESENNLRPGPIFPASAVCARLALGSVRRFHTAAYSLTGTKFQFGSRMASLWDDSKVSWHDCTRARSTNCRSAYYCWESALNRLCGLSPQCCPDQAAHATCRDNPDGHVWYKHGLTLAPTCAERMQTFSD